VFGPARVVSPTSRPEASTLSRWQPWTIDAMVGGAYVIVTTHYLDEVGAATASR
jgi:hypothetical protein